MDNRKDRYSKKFNPLVTVYIPTHNRLDLLKRALQSVQNQKYTNIEIIVIDDCSSDGTRRFLEEESTKDFRLKYETMTKNVGACFCRNKAIEMATGKFITGLDDDDYFLPDRIQDFVDFYKDRENIICLFSNTIFKNKQKGLVIHSLRDRFLPKKIKADDLIYNNYIGNQIFIKTVDLKKSGGFDVEMSMWQDLECYYNLLKSTGKYALNIGAYNYVQDVSHDKDRISNLNMEKAQKAYFHFIKKHQVEATKQKYLYSQFYKYDNSLIDISILCKKILKKSDINDTYLLFKTIIKKFLFFKV